MNTTRTATAATTDATAYEAGTATTAAGTASVGIAVTASVADVSPDIAGAAGPASSAAAAGNAPARWYGARRWSSPALVLRIVLAAALLLAACSADDAPGAEGAAPPAPPVAEPADEPAVDDEPARRERPDEPEPDDPAEEDPVPARVARAADHLDVYDAPGSDTVTHTLEPTTDFDSPRALLILGHQDDRLEVLLPVRPNGTTGWIAAGDVEVVEVELSVNVDLDARELTVLEAGEEVLTTEVAIGDADHPTPTGTFSITDKLDTGDPNGAYGPYALGLSAWSDVLTGFAGGDGQVGIHGTNAPESIGEAASHGCIRVDNAVIEQLAHLLPLGTPVTVS